MAEHNNDIALGKTFAKYDRSDSDKTHNQEDRNMYIEPKARNTDTTRNVAISSEMFERLYISPPNMAKCDLRKRFGNPTPIALVGFLIALSPLACVLMEWRGAGSNEAASIGAYYFFGGLLMSIGGLLEFVLGNTFPFVVFQSYGAFWLSLGTISQSNSPTGTHTQESEASLAFFFIFVAVLSFVFLICSIRTNIVFALILLTLLLGFTCLAAMHFHAAEDVVKTGTGAVGHRYQVASGASFFVAILAGWWILIAQMLAASELPFNLPVGDLSAVIRGRHESDHLV